MPPLPPPTHMSPWFGAEKPPHPPLLSSTFKVVGSNPRGPRALACLTARACRRLRTAQAEDERKWLPVVESRPRRPLPAGWEVEGAGEAAGGGQRGVLAGPAATEDSLAEGALGGPLPFCVSLSLPCGLFSKRWVGVCWGFGHEIRRGFASRKDHGVRANRVWGILGDFLDCSPAHSA